MICPNCKKEVPNLTRDHITPKWLIKLAKNLGLKKIKHKTIANIRKICKECNFEKGASLDMTNDLNRELVGKLEEYCKKLLS